MIGTRYEESERSMTITCPHCNFSRTVEPEKVPDRPVKVNCPKCNQGFTFDKTRPETEKPEQISCPACGLVQDKNDRCGGCGVTYAKIKERKEDDSEANIADMAPTMLDLFGIPAPKYMDGSTLDKKQASA